MSQNRWQVPHRSPLGMAGHPPVRRDQTVGRARTVARSASPSAHTGWAPSRRTRVLASPALLVVAEIGDRPVTRSGAILFFQLVNRRYEHASTVLNSSKGFEQWGESSRTRSWPPRCWTGSSIAATSATSGATATGCTSQALSAECAQHTEPRDVRPQHPPGTPPFRSLHSLGGASPKVSDFGWPLTPQGRVRRSGRPC